MDGRPLPGTAVLPLEGYSRAVIAGLTATKTGVLLIVFRGHEDPATAATATTTAAGGRINVAEIGAVMVSASGTVLWSRVISGGGDLVANSGWERGGDEGEGAASWRPRVVRVVYGEDQNHFALTLPSRAKTVVLRARDGLVRTMVDMNPGDLGDPCFAAGGGGDLIVPILSLDSVVAVRPEEGWTKGSNLLVTMVWSSTVQTPGNPLSGVVVAPGLVVALTLRGMTALDAGSGRSVWARELCLLPAASVTADGDLAVSCAASGLVFALLSRKDGSTLESLSRPGVHPEGESVAPAVVAATMVGGSFKAAAYIPGAGEVLILSSGLGKRAPEPPAVLDSSPSSVLLGFSYPSKGFTYFRLLYSKNCTGPYTAVYTGANDWYDQGNLATGIEQCWKVAAGNADGETPFSNPTRFTPSAPRAPGGGFWVLFFLGILLLAGGVGALALYRRRTRRGASGGASTQWTPLEPPQVHIVMPQLAEPQDIGPRPGDIALAALHDDGV